MNDAHDFDIDTFLARPLVAHVATNGPTVRPVWFLWEEDAFWWITGPWAQLDGIVQEDPRAALAIDTCDVETGEVRQVIAHGEIEIQAYERDRAIRKLRRYLGPDIGDWDDRFDPDAMRGLRAARASNDDCPRPLLQAERWRPAELTDESRRSPSWARPDAPESYRESCRAAPQGTTRATTTVHIVRRGGWRTDQSGRYRMGCYERRRRGWLS